MRKKEALQNINRFGTRILAAFLMPLFIGWFFYRFFDLGLVRVDQTTALHGRTTKYDIDRQHFKWYLNGESTRYDFWSFKPGYLATKQVITADSIEYVRWAGSSGYTYYNTLAHYLRVGARLRKEANSPYITVEQAHRLTRWRYRP